MPEFLRLVDGRCALVVGGVGKKRAGKMRDDQLTVVFIYHGAARVLTDTTRDFGHTRHAVSTFLLPLWPKFSPRFC